MTPILFIFRRVLQLVIWLWLMTLVTLVRIVMMIRILGSVMIVWRTVAHSLMVTSSKNSSSQTTRRVTQQMGDEVTLIEQL